MAPYSFFNAFCYVPPIVGFSSTNWKDSAAISRIPAVCWNLAAMDLAKQMNATAAHVARDVDELRSPGSRRALQARQRPRVAESPVAFECKLTQIIQLQGADGRRPAWVTFGEVVAVHIDKTFIQDGVDQTGLAHPIVRAGRSGYYFEIKPENMFEMIRPELMGRTSTSGTPTLPNPYQMSFRRLPMIGLLAGFMMLVCLAGAAFAGPMRPRSTTRKSRASSRPMTGLSGGRQGAGAVDRANFSPGEIDSKLGRTPKRR